MRPDAPRTRPFLASLSLLIAALWLWLPMVSQSQRSTLDVECSTLERHERPLLDFIARTKQAETKRASTGPGSLSGAGFDLPVLLADVTWQTFPWELRRSPVYSRRGGICSARGPPVVAWLVRC